jgi:exopolyphosphatase/guanosine-5'-triphosphate,3'-diphosphate pyrophosphatase
MARIVSRLTRVPTEERRKLPGVSSNRADILHAAAVVVDEVMDLVGAQTLTVAGQGLREGLLWQELRDESPLIPDVRAASVSGLARANGVDESAAEPVAVAATALFEATRQAHGLGPPELELLRHAARLAGIGMHIDFYNRDRHAEYLVHSGDLHGFAHREIVLLAALVRWADSGTPDLSPYKAIVQPEDTRLAAELAVLLGLARAVCRRVPSPVRGLSATTRKSVLRLQLSANGDLSAELHQLERQQRRLESALRLTLSVEVLGDQGA